MGKVIALPPSRKIATSQPDGATAVILFFTGVRYYRISDAELAKLAAPAPQRRAKTKVAALKTVSAKTVSTKTVSAKTAALARKMRKLA